MSSYAALNPSNRRYIAYRPCPEMRGQAQYLVSDHYAGEGGMSNTDLYMTVEEHREVLASAGYRSISELKYKGGMVLNSAA